MEDGIVAFLKEKVRVQFLTEGVQETEKANQLAMLQYEQGFADYQRVLDTQRALVQQQDNLAATRGKVALNLIAVYKALGGGWQTRLQANQTPIFDAPGSPRPPRPRCPVSPRRRPRRFPPWRRPTQPLAQVISSTGSMSASGNDSRPRVGRDRLESGWR